MVSIAAFRAVELGSIPSQGRKSMSMLVTFGQKCLLITSPLPLLKCRAVVSIRAQLFSGGLAVQKNHQLMQEISGLPDIVGRLFSDFVCLMCVFIFENFEINSFTCMVEP